QWIESCLPDDGGAVTRHFEGNAVAHGRSPASVSYRALLRDAGPITRRHRVLLSLAVNLSRSARSIRAAGGRDAGVAAVLGREVVALCRALDAADIEVDGVLGPGGLARCLRDAVARTTVEHDPGEETQADERAPSRWPWPMAVRPEWDVVRTDETWHATYWIAEWPRVEVTADFLGPLLLAPVRRSIALVMEPVSPSRAARQVARARTADIADGELRRRGGFLTNARQHRERHSVEERDAELADGHGQFRFVGYVTLTAGSRYELDAATVDLEQLAGQSHVELRRLFGEQDVAFACSLPIGRGLA
ncbi:MAG TPA: SCO6880 family protein, partial [Acidimicrobiales bacterium]|nr:SCO6880 family protein [Acidimicrobiales bacterium]